MKKSNQFWCLYKFHRPNIVYTYFLLKISMNNNDDQVLCGISVLINNEEEYGMEMNNVRDNIFDEDYLRKYHFYQLMMLYLHKHNGDCPYLKNNVRFQLHTMRFQLDTIMNRQFIWAPMVGKIRHKSICGLPVI